MIDLRAIVRGAVTRFFVPGTVLLLVGVVPLVLTGGTGIAPFAPLIMIGYMVSATTGFAGVLALLRHRLGADAPVAGRPVLTAGVIAPLAIMLGLMAKPHADGRWLSWIACMLVGAALGLAMFSPWLSKVKSGPVVLDTLPTDPTALPPAPFAGASRTYSRQYVADDDEPGSV